LFLKLIGSTISFCILLLLIHFYRSVVIPFLNNGNDSSILFIILFILTQIILTPFLAKIFVKGDQDFLNVFFMSLGVIAAILIGIIFYYNSLNSVQSFISFIF
jgi:hypothetical protein